MLTEIRQSLARYVVDQNSEAVMRFAVAGLAANFQQILDASTGLKHLSPPQAIAGLQEIQAQYGSLGVYLALYQAADCPRISPVDPLHFEKPLAVDQDTLALTRGHNAYSLPKIYGVVDPSDVGHQVQKIAEVGVDENGLVVFSHPHHGTGDSDRTWVDRFKDWGEGWPDADTVVFKPTNLGHGLKVRYIERGDYTTFIEVVSFTNPQAIDFPTFNVITAFLFIDKCSKISETDLSSPLQRILGYCKEGIR